MKRDDGDGNIIYSADNDAEIRFEHDKYMAIAALSMGLLFEYDVNTDTMVNIVMNNGSVQKAVSISDFSVNAYMSEIFCDEDETAVRKFVSELRSDMQKVQAEIRTFAKERQQYEWYHISGLRVVSEDGSRNVVVGRIVNIEYEKQIEQEESERALRDILTGLYTREAAAKKVEQCIISRNGKEIDAFFLIDIEKMGDINKTLGRMFADEVIRNVAADIRKAFYPTDIVGRAGAGRFVVLMRDAGGLDNIMNKAEQLKAILDDTYIGEQYQSMNGTIGVAVAPIEGSTFDELFEKAEKAMFYAREHNSNGIEIYDGVRKNIYSQEYDMRMQCTEESDSMDFASSSGDSIIRVAFKLIEETKDAVSAVNMLLRRMARWLDVPCVSIIETTDKPYTLQTMYEYCSDEQFCDLGAVRTMTKSRFDRLLNLYSIHQGMYIKDKKAENGSDMYMAEELEHRGARAVAQCAFYENGQFVGCMNFVDSKERIWHPDELNIISVLTSIIFSYMLKMRTLEKIKEEVERFNCYDSTTGLMRFDRFRQTAEKFIMNGKRNRYVVVYSDIYNFKYINEHYGYDTGDLILKRFAEHIMQDSTSESAACRIVSDNFIIFAPWRNEEEGEGENSSTNLFLDRIKMRNSEFADIVHELYPESNITITSGMCVFDRRSTSFMKAVSLANIARKQAKKPGEDSCILYTEEMGQDVMRRAAYLSEVRMALDRREFVVHFQPKVDVDGGRIVGAEALVRWKKPDGTIIYPGEFIPVLENTKMIKDVDFYVYEEVFRYLRDCINSGRRVVPISVNVSRIHFMDRTELCSRLKQLIARYQVPPQLIEIELTEDLLAEDIDGVVEVINAIRKMGIKVSMDDFGSGYSSFNVLKKIPLDVLKLDKAFMDDIDSADKEDIIISSLIDMSKRMGLKVLCEGVENAEQVDFLANAGCDMIQGYFFSKPVDISDFDEMLKNETVSTDRR